MKLIICILAVIGTVTAGLLGGDLGHYSSGQDNGASGNIQTLRIIQETATASHHDNRFSQTQAFSQQPSQEYIPPQSDSVKTLRIIHETVQGPSYNQGPAQQYLPPEQPHSLPHQDVQTLQIIQENGPLHQHQPTNNGFIQSHSHGQSFSQPTQDYIPPPLPISQSHNQQLLPEQVNNAPSSVSQTFPEISQSHVQQPNVDYLPPQNNGEAHGDVQTLRIVQESGSLQSNLHVQQPNADYLPPQNHAGSHVQGIDQSHQGHIQQNNIGTHHHEQVQTFRIIQESGSAPSHQNSLQHIQQPNLDYIPPENHAGSQDHVQTLRVIQESGSHHSNSHVQQPNADYLPPLSESHGIDHSHQGIDQHVQQPNLEFLPSQNLHGSHSNGIGTTQHIQQPSLAYLPPHQTSGQTQSHHNNLQHIQQPSNLQHIQQPNIFNNLAYLPPHNSEVKTLRIINEHVERHSHVPISHHSHGEVKTLRIIKEPIQSHVDNHEHHNHITSQGEIKTLRIVQEAGHVHEEQQPHIKTIRIIQAGPQHFEHEHQFESYNPVQQEIKTLRIIKERPASHEVKTLRIIQEGAHHSGLHEGHSKLIKIINEH